MEGFPVQTTQPAQPNQPSGRPKKFYLIILFIILLIALVLVGGYFFFVRQNNTAVDKSTPTTTKDDLNNESEKMSNKLQAALTNELLIILTKTEEIIGNYENKQGLTQEEIEEVEQAKQLMASVEGETMQEKANNLTAEIVSRWSRAFIVSSAEAKNMLAGEYNDSENKAQVKDYIDNLASKNVPLPYFFTYLVGEYQSGKLDSGVRLELMKRLLGEYLKEISFNVNLCILV